MNIQTYTIAVNIPSVDEFATQYRQYGNLAKNEYKVIFELLMSPESFTKAKIVTLDLLLPAVAGVAEDCYRTVEEDEIIEWSSRLKQFIGATVASLMLANGFDKTSKKRSIPHHAFTKGEVYQLTDNIDE